MKRWQSANFLQAQLKDQSQRLSKVFYYKFDIIEEEEWKGKKKIIRKGFQLYFTDFINVWQQQCNPTTLVEQNNKFNPQLEVNITTLPELIYEKFFNIQDKKGKLRYRITSAGDIELKGISIISFLEFQWIFRCERLIAPENAIFIRRNLIEPFLLIIAHQNDSTKKLAVEKQIIKDELNEDENFANVEQYFPSSNMIFENEIDYLPVIQFSEENVKIFKECDEFYIAKEEKDREEEERRSLSPVFDLSKSDGEESKEENENEEEEEEEEEEDELARKNKNKKIDRNKKRKDEKNYHKNDVVEKKNKTQKYKYSQHETPEISQALSLREDKKKRKQSLDETEEELVRRRAIEEKIKLEKRKRQQKEEKAKKRRKFDLV